MKIYESLLRLMAGKVAGKKISWATVFFIVLAGFTLGIMVTGGNGPEAESSPSEQAIKESSSVWTCSMHPQIRLPRPGKCPICFMDLVPVAAGADAGVGPRQLSMSPDARLLAGIATSPVRRGPAENEIRLFGKIAYDETRLVSLTARFSGRLEKLHADFTGISVNADEPLADIYSPELRTAEEELIQASTAYHRAGEKGQDQIESSARAMLDAVREKLRLWGLSSDQIAQIEAEGKASDYLTIMAPAGGIVVRKPAQVGQYVNTGDLLYAIADLSRLWVLMSAYESDLVWLRQGQKITFTSPSFPGEVFRATVSFIDPVVDPETRTVSVRAIIDNPRLRLKPDMFVHAIIKGRIDLEGEVLADNESGGAPLLIPATAPLITGTRAVVYVELPGTEEPVFEGREVVLGPRAGDYYIVREGLAEGELVVVNGAFKIDSELQIQARPSMMNPDGGAISSYDHNQHAPTTVGAEAAEQTPATDDPARAGMGTPSSEASPALSPIYDAYFAIQMALANDNLNRSVEGFRALGQKAADVDINLFSGDKRESIKTFLGDISGPAARGAGSKNIEEARDAFYHLSRSVIGLHDAFGHSDNRDYYLTFCPMARNNAGAYWLQTENIVWNSFYGDRMLRCGEIRKSLPPQSSGGR